MPPQAQQTDLLYNDFSKGLYRLTGNEASDDYVMNVLASNTNADNAQMVAVSGSDIMSGVGTGTTQTATGSYQSGKKTFDNTVKGYILGFDPKDGNAKFYIGNSTSYLNWDGASMTVAGSITATTGTIGGFTIGATTLTGGSGLILSSVGGGTITGGTIQSGASGSRVAISASIGLGSLAAVNLYNSDGTSIATLNATDTTILFSSTSPNTASRMFQFVQFIQNGSNTNPMVYLEAANVSTGTVCLSVLQKGVSDAISISLASGSSGNGITISTPASGTGTGILGKFSANNSASNAHCVEIYAMNDNGANALFVQQGDINHATGTTPVAQLRQSTSVSAGGHNYYRILSFNGNGTTRTLWIAEGFSPNTDALSATTGDVCINGDGGKVYHCTGAGTWSI